jgi:(p)ppGpp synthase/HD superfamily hydrolase
MSMTIVDRALVFATTAHASIGQVRKYSGEPYIVHPIEVMMLVRGVEHDETMLAAALLHDVVEDTPVTLEDVTCEFGASVASHVFWLTDASRPEDGNRAARKAIDRAHIAMASAAAQTIKLADLISNSRSIVERDPDFAKVYLREKARLLAVLTRGDPALKAMAWGFVPARYRDAP